MFNSSGLKVHPSGVVGSAGLYDFPFRIYSLSRKVCTRQISNE